MQPKEVEVSARALLIKMHVITGWVMSEDANLRNILLDQFCKKLVESYADTNADEFEYAIRTYGTVVKDWGKKMNLSLVDEVMSPYLTKRVELSQIEEQKKTPRMLEEGKLSNITNQDWFNDTKSQVKNKKLTVEFVPLELYEWAIKEQIINPSVQEKWDYFLQAINIRQAKLYADLMLDGSNKEAIRLYTEFMNMKTAQCFEGDELLRLRNTAKKLILFDYYKTAI